MQTNLLLRDLLEITLLTKIIVDRHHQNSQGLIILVTWAVMVDLIIEAVIVAGEETLITMAVFHEAVHFLAIEEDQLLVLFNNF